MSECFYCGIEYTQATLTSGSSSTSSTSSTGVPNITINDANKAGYCSPDCYDKDMTYFEDAGFAFDESFATETEQFEIKKAKEKSSDFKKAIFNIYTGKDE